MMFSSSGTTVWTHLQTRIPPRAARREEFELCPCCKSPGREHRMTVTITPLTPVLAGEVGAIDLRQVHDRCSLEAIRSGMDKYAVLVFRDQQFTDQEQLDFAQRFDGTLHARTSSSAIAGNRFGNE